MRSLRRAWKWIETHRRHTIQNRNRTCPTCAIRVYIQVIEYDILDKSFLSSSQMNVMDVVSKFRCLKSYGLWDEAVPESGGFSPDAAVPPARRQQTEQLG